MSKYTLSVPGLYDAGTTKALSDKTVTTFSSLSPGHLVNVTVKKHAANGIRCSFLGVIQVGYFSVSFISLFVLSFLS